MINTILGKKQSMSQHFVDGVRTPVTLVKVGPCVVTQVKTADKDNYNAVQLGFGSRSIKSISKPLQGHLKGAVTTNKSKKTAPHFLSEVRVDEPTGMKVGQNVSVSDVFTEGDTVAVTGVTKGKGFAGVVKRWGFAGARRTHGMHGHLRKPGSIGQGTDPGRVRKGKKMGGRMGTETVTVSNLKVVAVDPEKNEMAISGTIPGHRGTNLVIMRTSEAQVKEENTNEAEKAEE